MDNKCIFREIITLIKKTLLRNNKGSEALNAPFFYAYRVLSLKFFGLI